MQGRRKVWKFGGGGGASSNVVAIMCPPVEIELTDLPKQPPACNSPDIMYSEIANEG